METNEELKEQIFNIIESQLNENNPPEVKSNYNRLIKEGYNDYQSRHMIAQCLSVELFNILELKKPFNNERYVENLSKLPKEPFD